MDGGGGGAPSAIAPDFDVCPSMCNSSNRGVVISGMDLALLGLLSLTPPHNRANTASACDSAQRDDASSASPAVLHNLAGWSAELALKLCAKYHYIAIEGGSRRTHGKRSHRSCMSSALLRYISGSTTSIVRFARGDTHVQHAPV